MWLLETGKYLSEVEPLDSIPSLKSWLSKSPVAFFRGSTSGLYGSQNRRYQLALYCREHPDLCDAKFTQAVQWWNEKELTRVNLMDKSFISHKEQCEMYRTIIVVDGNGPPASRLKELLSMCNATQLFCCRKRIWKSFTCLDLHLLLIMFHYRKVLKIWKKIDWINSNPDKAVSIIKNARSYASRDIFRMMILLVFVVAEFIFARWLLATMIRNNVKRIRCL